MYDSPDITPNYTREYRNDSWQQPIWLAFLASVGIHAILGINLPNISLFSQQVKRPPTVGLVELTPEQISRLPQPKTEPDISFSNIQPPPEISEIPVQQESFPRLPSSTRTTPSVSNLPRTSVERSSSYEIPDRPPTRPTVRLPRRESFPSSVSRLPQGETSVDDFSYSIPRGTTPLSPPPPPQETYRRPLPNLNRPSLPPLPSLPEENQGPTDAEIRRSLNLTDEVFDSGLFAQNPSSEPGNSSTSRGSLLDGLRRPQERYQDKIATAPSNSSPTTATTETPTTATTETPTTPAQQDPTKINRLSEGPLTTALRERKARERLANQRQQPEPVAVVTPETRQPEVTVEPQETPQPEVTVEPQENPAVTAEIEVEVEQPTPAAEEPREHKGSILEDFKRQAREQRRENLALTPEATTTPKPEPLPTPTPTVAARPEVEPSPVEQTAPEVEPSPVQQTAPEVEPSPVEQTAPEVEPSPVEPTLPQVEPSPVEPTLPQVEPSPVQQTLPQVEEETSAKAPTTEGEPEFKDLFLAKLEQYRRRQELMDAAGDGVFSSKEKLGVNGGVAYMEWAIALGLEDGNLTTPTNISDVYPDAACSENLTGQALVGVLVNADGEIVEGPKLLLGSGSDILDEAALSAVSDRSFETSDKSKAYQYAFSFNNSGCVGQGS